LRGRATRQGYSLVKFREGSRWSNEFGPFMVTDPFHHRIVAHGMTLEEAADWLKKCGNLHPAPAS
jgi:hypothetical protein